MKIGVWGLGSIGIRHARNALSCGLEIIGFDPDLERGKIFTEVGGILVTSEEALLSQAEAIIICSPNQFHFSHLERSIENSRHVLIEKPISHSCERLNEIIQSARKKSLVIAPAMNMRFDAVLQRSKEIIEDGKFGHILWSRFVCSSYLPYWRPHQDHRKGYTNDLKTGGVIFDIIHEFDMAQYLFGELAVQSCVAVNSGAIGLQVEDCAEIILKDMNRNSLVSIHLDYISKTGQRYHEIQFEKYHLKADLNARLIEIIDENEQVVLKEYISQSDTQCYIDEMVAFIKAIEGRAPFPCQPEEAVKVLDNVIKARQMAGLGV